MSDMAHYVTGYIEIIYYIRLYKAEMAYLATIYSLVSCTVICQSGSDRNCTVYYITELNPPL